MSHNTMYVPRAILDCENTVMKSTIEKQKHLLGRVLYMHVMKNTSSAMSEESVNALMNEIREAIR